MENHQFLNKVVSHLFPSSCQFSNSSDVIQNSIVSSPTPLKNSNIKSQLETKQHYSSSKGEWFSSEEEEEDDSKCYGENRNVSVGFSSSNSLDQSFRRKKTKSHLRNVANNMACRLFESPPHSRDIPQLFGDTARARLGRTKSRQRANTGRLKPWSDVSIKSADIYYYTHAYRKTSNNHHKTANGRSKTVKDCRKTGTRWTDGEIGGGIEDSYVVEIKTTDPYNDFRESMVEMIVAKQIFGFEQLERLLETFLSLNSRCHYKVIVAVYFEVCETLFPQNRPFY